MNLKTGQQGEQIARKYLEKKGYKILNCNYKTKIGEIDIIIQKGTLIVFIEVKTRRSDVFGIPREAVNYKKQQTLYKIAQQYILSNGFQNMNFRFDVVEIILSPDGNNQIEHIENAF